MKGLERKTTDESEHFLWKDDIKVPCGRLIPSVHNEYAIYDLKQVNDAPRLKFLNRNFFI